jgi:tRNA(Ile)-lysidine synthetase-like protein
VSQRDEVADTDLVEAIAAADRRHGLFAHGDLVVVAVSAGPDSVALADALRRYAPARDLVLHIAHLDHMLRDESAEDAVHVAQLAAEWRIPARFAARDVAGFAGETGRSLEDAARSQRYAFLASVADEVGAASVAVAHHADDQAETLLMNLVRGSGLDGLKGMTPASPFPLGPAELLDLGLAASLTRLARLRLVRPLLAVSRATILGYLAARQLEWREDPSNRDRRFLRNRVRHELIPLLETMNPRVVDALVRTATIVADEVALLDADTDAAWARGAIGATEPVRFRLQVWRGLPPALQRRVLRRMVADLAARRQYGWEHVEALRLAVSGQRPVSGLPGGIELDRTGVDFAILVRPLDLPALGLGPEGIMLPESGELHLPGGWRITCAERQARPGEKVPADPWRALFDAEWWDGGLVVRNRRKGDRMAPLGMSGRHQSLQDLFVDHHVARAEREGWPLVARNDTIIWVPGLRLAESARLPPGARRTVLVTVVPPARLGHS